MGLKDGATTGNGNGGGVLNGDYVDPSDKALEEWVMQNTDVGVDINQVFKDADDLNRAALDAEREAEEDYLDAIAAADAIRTSEGADIVERMENRNNISREAEEKLQQRREEIRDEYGDRYEQRAEAYKRAQADIAARKSEVRKRVGRIRAQNPKASNRKIKKLLKQEVALRKANEKINS